MVWGKDHEAEAVEYFERQTGLICHPCGFFTYTDHAGGSPDRLVGDDAILEVKCPFESVNQVAYLGLVDHFDIKSHHFDYWVQCQANMLFTDRQRAHFVTYDPRMISDKHKMQHIEIPADNEFHDLIRTQISLAVKEKLSIIQSLTI